MFKPVKFSVCHVLAALGIVLALSTGACLQAQSAAPSAPSSGVPSPADSLVVGPGDTLHVVVFDSPELEQRVSVTDAGNANFDLIGDVHVAGQNVNQLARTLEGLLVQGHYLLHPNVTVMIEQSATMQVSVLGEVHNPGAYQIGTSRNILDIISLAGGLTEAADRNIVIKRRQGDIAKVFIPNNADQAISDSVLVYPGDTVVIPKAGIIYVLGDVNRPGGYFMQRDSKLSALQAVSMAGGLLPNAAAPKSLIIRKTTDNAKGFVDIPLELRGIQKGKKPDPQLQADDVIYVPFSYTRNALIQSSAIFASAASAVIYTAY